MPLDEAVALLAGTDVIAPGSRLDEARRTVLAVVRRASVIADTSGFPAQREYRDCARAILGIDQ